MGEAYIVRKNIPASNGMIHALDGVLVPGES
ncbi:fasciclin domain-containing protein [Methyloceanibacter caenitepidi]